jgi:hypothetical protein
MNNFASSAAVGNAYAAQGPKFVASLLLSIGLLTISVFGALPHLARAQAIDPNTFPATKVSADLVAALNAVTPPKVKWVKQDGGGRYVKVIIVAAGSDPQLTALRSAIVAAKGSVYYQYQSVPGVSAMLPGSQVLNIAARADVDSMSPNRPAIKTGSFLETTTGVDGIRTTSDSGVRRLRRDRRGIAILGQASSTNTVALRPSGGNRSRRSSVEQGVVPGR